ncbi:MAG: O-antigen ligase [Verrucomicrobia bacterium]|nr:MAG: O-antigen ligase [Verrucomicrobiota bacterium]
MFPRRIAVCLFAMALVYAPFAHGCATNQAWFVLDGLLVLAALFHLRECLAYGKRPTVPGFPLVAMLLILGLGVAQALNPKYIYDPVTRSMEALHSFRPHLPGTMDRRSSLIALIHWSALGIGFTALLDLLRDREVRWFLMGTIALTGLVMAVFGIALKFQGSQVIPFTNSPCITFFGTYVYHAHAAAFLNLCWPASLVFAIRSIYGYQPIARALWINGFLLTFFALFINISKFGHLAAIPGLLFALVVLHKGMPPREARVPPLVLVLLVLILLAGAATFIFPLAGVSVRRWDEVMHSGFGGRPILYEIALSMVQQYPLWGTGSGTFYIVFPYFSAHLGTSMQGLFSHAHQDYLQTMVEWGLPGAVVWFALVGVGFLKGCRDHWLRPEELSTGAAIVALTIVGLHAMVDFPMQMGSLRLYAATYLAILWRVRLPEDNPQA